MSDLHTPYTAAPSPPPAGYRLFEETQRREAGDILHKVLPGLLPEGYRLAVHRRLGIVTVMTCEEEDKAGTGTLAHYTFGQWRPLTTEEVAAARKRLRKAEQAGTAEDLLRPLRNLLSRTRLKLHSVGLTVTSLLETGYQLMPLERVRVSSRKREQEASEHGNTGKGTVHP